jgi:hypothetical protein
VSTAEPVEKGRRIVGAERGTWIVECSQRYDAGESIATIATSLGRSYGWVRRILAEGGVTMRPRGGPNRRRARAQHGCAPNRRGR